MTGIAEPECPEVSIVIPTYERRQFLSEAVASVKQQTFPNWELHIVDDASPTPVREEEFADPRIKVLRHERNKGLAAARNTGAQAATGKWLAFLDDDDLWDPHRLECALDWTASKPADICVVWTQVLGTAAKRPGQGHRLEGNCHAKILTTTTPNFGATMIRRDAFVPLDESYLASQDLEWWIRVTKHTSLTTVPAFLHIWRRHDAPRHGNGRSQRIAQSWRLLRDHEDYFIGHPAARSFRLFRLGVMLEQSTECREAAMVYWRVANAAHVAPRTRASAVKRLIKVLPRAWLSALSR